MDDYLMTSFVLVGNAKTGQVVTRKFEGEQSVLIFSDSDLAAEYIEQVGDCPEGTAPIELGDTAFHQLLHELSTTYRRIVIDFNHKTGRGRPGDIADLLAKWDK